MSDEPKENRINVEDLPQAEREVGPEEAKEVQGGVDPLTGQTRLIIGDDQGVFGSVGGPRVNTFDDKTGQ